MQSKGYKGPLDIQEGQGVSIEGCAVDAELWFAVTLQYDTAPTNDEPGITFGASDYSQRPAAFPLTNHGFRTVTGNDLKANPSNAVVSFYGQIPEGSRFAIFNDTDVPVRAFVRWSVRKVEV